MSHKVAGKDSLERVQSMYQPILEVLDFIGSNVDGTYGGVASADANGIYDTMKSFKFLIALVVTRSILAYLLPLTTELQLVKIDIIEIYRAFDTVISTLKSVRINVEIKHDAWCTRKPLHCLNQ